MSTYCRLCNKELRFIGQDHLCIPRIEGKMPEWKTSIDGGRRNGKLRLSRFINGKLN